LVKPQRIELDFVPADGLYLRRNPQITRFPNLVNDGLVGQEVGIIRLKLPLLQILLARKVDGQVVVSIVSFIEFFRITITFHILYISFISLEKLIK
jgi:hypothetical protein